jgi:hypothetical protein
MRKSLSLTEMYRGSPANVKKPDGTCLDCMTNRRQPSRHVVRTRRIFGGSIPVLAVVLGCGLTWPQTVIAQCEPLLTASAGAGRTASLSFSCRFDATLTRTFTPPTAPKGTYRVFVTGASIDKVISAFKSVANSPGVPGAWAIQQTDPLSAFGEAGPYDGTKVARLYAGRRARVARGPVVQNGRTMASITVVSPYPDASMTRLEPGSLVIEYRTRPPK